MNHLRNSLAKSSLFADAMLLLAVLGWAVSYPMAKHAMEDWGSQRFFFLGGRFWLAFVLFAILAARRSSWQELKAHAEPALWTGLILVAVFGFQYKALTIGSAGEVAFITAFSSVLVPIGLWLVSRKRVDKATWLGMVIATLGVVVFVWSGDSGFKMDAAAVLTFVAAAGVAAYIITMGHFMSQKNADGEDRFKRLPFLTVQFLVLSVIASCISMVNEIPFKGIPAWSNKAIVGMAFMAVIATAGAFYIQSKYQGITKPERAALVFTLESPFVGLFGYLFLGEVFTARMIIGATLIVLGVGVAEYLAARKPPATTVRPVSNECAVAQA